MNIVEAVIFFLSAIASLICFINYEDFSYGEDAYVGIHIFRSVISLVGLVLMIIFGATTLGYVASGLTVGLYLVSSLKMIFDWDISLSMIEMISFFCALITGILMITA